MTFRRGKRVAGRLMVFGVAGDNTAEFNGSLGGKRLARGRYDILGQVRNGRGISRVQRVTITVA